MHSQRSEPSASLSALALQSLLPIRRRLANIAVTITLLMAAVFLVLGMEAKSHELRDARANAGSVGVRSAASSPEVSVR